MNIYLIGYRCSGKTTVGKALADRMGRRFMDCDAELVKAAGRSIKQIVAHRGWDAFREMERSVLKRVCGMDAVVAATGGGVVLNGANVRDMKRSGVTVWLKAEAGTLKDRILADGATEAFRPALSGRAAFEEIESVLEQRLPLYEAAADVSVDTDDAAVDAVCESIRQALKELTIEHRR